MAFKEVQGGNGGGNHEDREFLSAKIGLDIEGVLRGMSRAMPSQYGGEYRVVSIDLTDGRKVAIRATKILLERLEDADLEDGDKVKVVIESATTKDGKRTYANPRLFVDRDSEQAPRPAAAPPVAADDEPPF